MMNETDFGTRDALGEYHPEDPISYGPLFTWPPRPGKLLTWLFGMPGYILPWNLVMTVIAAVVWLFLYPPLTEMTAFHFGWIAQIALINYALVLVWYGAWHGWLYTLRRQGTQFKYNRTWPKLKSAVFLFGKQNADNMVWTLASGVPIWTAYVVVALYLYANGYVTLLNPADHPVWFAVLLFVVPLLHEAHFFFAHRLVHVPFLYRHFHALHHKNVNPAPWSGLAMHPVEHLIYFSSIVMVAAIYSHPIHMMSVAIRTGLGPAIGHTGFDKVDLGADRSVDAGVRAHYLHHKLFEVNYSDGSVPLDKWFGSFHDGTPASDDRLRERLKKRAAKRRA